MAISVSSRRRACSARWIVNAPCQSQMPPILMPIMTRPASDKSKVLPTKKLLRLWCEMQTGVALSRSREIQRQVGPHIITFVKFKSPRPSETTDKSPRCHKATFIDLPTQRLWCTLKLGTSPSATLRNHGEGNNNKKNEEMRRQHSHRGKPK